MTSKFTVLIGMSMLFNFISSFLAVALLLNNSETGYRFDTACSPGYDLRIRVGKCKMQNPQSHTLFSAKCVYFSSLFGFLHIERTNVILNILC